MLRRCDGTDPNLTRPCEPDDERGRLTPWRDSRPCDCGNVFDDVWHRVTFPHERI